MLDITFRWHFEIVFLLSPENRVCHFMQIVRQFAWNVRPCFLGKNKNNIINLSSAEFASRAVKIKPLDCTSPGIPSPAAGTQPQRGRIVIYFKIHINMIYLSAVCQLETHKLSSQFEMRCPRENIITVFDIIIALCTYIFNYCKKHVAKIPAL